MLHPQSVRALAQARSEGGLTVTAPEFDLAAVRRDDAAAALQEDRRAMAYVRDVDAGGVPCRIYRPRAGAPLLLYAHGGGWVLGDLDTHDRFLRELALRTGWAVVAVDYRRAPEHPYPQPLDDVEQALRWVRDHAGDHDLDASLVVGAGDSSGANLIAALSVRTPKAVDFQILAYPPLDPACDADSFRTEDIALLPTEEMRWYWRSYAPTSEAQRNPEVAPVYANDLSRMPPTMLISAEHDVLRDEDETFAARLADAGVPVVASRALGMAHGFWRRPWEFAAADASLDQIAGTLAGLRRG